MAGVPVVSQEADTGCYVGSQEVEREPVMVSQSAGQRHQVEDGDAGSDDDALADLEAVNTGQDVDGVGAEDGQHPHVEIVEEAELYAVTQDPSEHGGDHNLRPVGGHVVDHQQGEAGHAWQEQLVAPLQVQDVVSEPQEKHTGDRKQGGDQLDKLRVGEGGGDGLLEDVVAVGERDHDEADH